MVLGSAQDPKKYDMRIHSPYNFLVDSVKFPKVPVVLLTMSKTQTTISAMFNNLAHSRPIAKMASGSGDVSLLLTSQQPHVSLQYGLKVKNNPGAGNCGYHVLQGHLAKID